jgi:hypothetical protein
MFSRCFRTVAGETQSASAISAFAQALCREREHLALAVRERRCCPVQSGALFEHHDIGGAPAGRGG